MLRCKRRSQMSRYGSPVRPHMLHALPHGYAEGDVATIVQRNSPPAWDSFTTTKQTTGERQGCCLMHAQPVSFHKLHPAYHGTVRRVYLIDFHSLPIATGEQVCLHPAIAEARQHPAMLCRLPLERGLLPLKVQTLYDNGLPCLTGCNQLPDIVIY